MQQQYSVQGALFTFLTYFLKVHFTSSVSALRTGFSKLKTRTNMLPTSFYP